MALEERPAQPDAAERVRGAVVLRWRRGVDLYSAQVLGADEAVLAWAEKPDRRAMVAVERAAIEVLGDQYVVSERILDGGGGPVAIETGEDEVGHRRARSELRLDDPPVEGLERDA